MRRNVISPISGFVVVAFAAALVSFGALSAAGSPAASAAGTRPHAIVSLSPTATEMLFAIGAGKQVVAVDDQSTFPKAAPRTDLSGINLNIEAVAGYEPDLVVASDDTARGGLDALGIDLLVLPAANRLSDTYHQLSELGRATGHVKEAAGVIERMKHNVQALGSRVPKRANRPLAYYELDDTLYSATSSTFIGQILSIGGFANIADAADKDGSGYPQLSPEYVVDANPAVIFLADSKCCRQTAKTVAARAGFSGLAAVGGHHVVVLDDDVASRWGPRVVSLLRRIVKANRSL